MSNVEYKTAGEYMLSGGFVMPILQLPGGQLSRFHGFDLL
ncbi:hypothetical protein SAMN05216327_102515 [Dyadobacter sp. SG02]|nr:hypothetical protein SAMN05216327_102515 [Dyadobacter sp. SG02]